LWLWLQGLLCSGPGQPSRPDFHSSSSMCAFWKIKTHWFSVPIQPDQFHKYPHCNCSLPLSMTRGQCVRVLWIPWLISWVIGSHTGSPRYSCQKQILHFLPSCLPNGISLNSCLLHSILSHKLFLKGLPFLVHINYIK
jgi:hypothetical protein